MTGPTIYLNGATLMTTPTDGVLAVAREAGFAGIEARAERLLGRTDELHAAARAAAEGEVLSLNGVSLTLRADGSMDRRVLEEDLPPRLAICKDVRTHYLLAVAPRAAGVPRGAAMAGLREALELVADRAARSGVRAAFEFLGFPDCPVNTPAQAAELVARKLVDMLRSQGYSGPWSLETFNPTYWTEDPAEVAGRGLAATKGVLSLG